jgi:hypothetical protein
MSEIGIFLFKHLGPAALVILLGFIADYISSHSLKADVVRWMSRRERIDFSRPIVTRVLNSFLEGYVQKIFASRLWSFKFLFRSSLVSFSIFVVVIVLQRLFYPEEFAFEFSFFGTDTLGAICMLSVGLVLNWFIDYLANVKTYSLLRMASESGRIFDFLLTVFADLALTITLFVAVFPATAVVNIYIFEWFNTDTTIELRLTEPFISQAVVAASSEYTSKLTALNGAKAEVHSFLVTIAQLDAHLTFASPISDQLNYVTIYTFDEADDDTAIARYIGLLNRVGSNAKISAGSKVSENDPISIEVDRDTVFGFDDFAPLYYAAAAQVNEQRRYVLQMLALRVSRVDFASAALEAWPLSQGGIVICKDGSFVDFDTKLATEQKLPCEAKTFFLGFSLRGEEDLLEIRGMMGVVMPITPFFVTSFSLSIMYYCILAMCFVGILTLNALRYLFSSHVFNITERPFVILSLFAFPFFLAGGYIISWLI